MVSEMRIDVISCPCIACLLTLFMFVGCDRQADKPQAGARGRETCIVENSVPLRRVLSNVESNAVARSFDRITEAYTNGQIEAMRDLSAQMPGVITNVINWHYIEFIRVFSNLVDKEFLTVSMLYDFNTKDECCYFMDRNLLAVRIMGELCLRRQDYSGMLPRIDKEAFRQLVRYKEKFHKEGRIDCEECVDRRIAEWIAQIESETGFTRMYMKHQISVQHYLVEQRGWTIERLLNAIRHEADGLIRAGYTPKWLDKEFPAVPVAQH